MTNSLMIARQSGESDYKNSTSMIVNSPEKAATLRNPENASISESSSASTSSTSHGNFFIRNNKNRMGRGSHSSSLTSDSSTSSLSSMTPSVIDLSARRSISDSVVLHCSGSTISYDNKNTMFMMINRSGSSPVKKKSLQILLQDAMNKKHHCRNIALRSVNNRLHLKKKFLY